MDVVMQIITMYFMGLYHENIIFKITPNELS